MGPETEADLKALRADFARLQADVASLASTLQQLARHGRSEGVAQASAALDDVETKLREGVATLTKQAQEKPAAAVAVTFGVGLILGLLFGGRRA